MGLFVGSSYQSNLRNGRKTRTWRKKLTASLSAISCSQQSTGSTFRSIFYGIGECAFAGVRRQPASGVCVGYWEVVPARAWDESTFNASRSWKRREDEGGEVSGPPAEARGEAPKATSSRRQRLSRPSMPVRRRRLGAVRRRSPRGRYRRRPPPSAGGPRGIALSASWPPPSRFSRVPLGRTRRVGRRRIRRGDAQRLPAVRDGAGSLKGPWRSLSFRQ